MKHRRDEEELSAGEVIGCIALLVVLALLSVFVIVVGISEVSANRFDKAFGRGQVAIEASYLALGEVGHPLSNTPSEDVPTGSIIGHTPRMFMISGCEAFDIPDETIGIHLATKFPQPELIAATMPPDPVGSLVICSPEGAAVEMIMWAQIQHRD